ncbi:hypothetical protein PPL_05827 [Heterostelium album PN500]|uniref:Uncharacterized protein n=1 Tax=Heterostelium pallidum (strain ATCC 26659 / Pp 5 / PN500) TaxID=670386 RepID=D3BBF9_HETP5|nr:hypothetical protein PPL_05827 [Heterostelium album PN500]EFA80992.1 hypothetical protein PPL_05827 [Heterostelium album PN500]|eukprot:XP_020433110.1 hypothetical protein PPL_05827 [Heterostelium album PN500]
MNNDNLKNKRSNNNNNNSKNADIINNNNSIINNLSKDDDLFVDNFNRLVDLKYRILMGYKPLINLSDTTCKSLTDVESITNGKNHKKRNRSNSNDLDVNDNNNNNDNNGTSRKLIKSPNEKQQQQQQQQVQPIYSLIKRNNNHNYKKNLSILDLYDETFTTTTWRRANATYNRYQQPGKT